MFFFRKLLIRLSLAALLLAVALLAFDYFIAQKAFPARTYISTVNVSFLSPQQALEKISRLPPSEVFAALITLEADNKNYSFRPEELGVSVLTAESVQLAFALTHQGNYFTGLKQRLSSAAPLVAPLSLSVNQDELKQVLTVLATKVASASKEAAIVFDEETGGYHIESDDLGRVLDQKNSAEFIVASLLKGKKVIPLIINYSYPRITEAELRANPPVYRISAYTTYYGSHDSPNRIHNIKLVASWIDGALLLPGDRFSVVNILGDVTKERGYKEAFVIVSGQLVPLLGGGSCQIATTLYNAVSLADLKILQRRNHSFYFNIYPLGRDAGVYPGQLDFRFKNDTPFPIMIKAVATSKKLSFRIYGTPMGKEVKFSPATIFCRNSGGKYLPRTLGFVIRNDVPFKTEVVRSVYDNEGKVLSEEKIYSYYRLYGDKANVPIRRPEPR